MAPYAGFPACWEGLLMADEVFENRKKDTVGLSRLTPNRDQE